MKYARFSDDFLSNFRLDDNGETLVLTDKLGCARAVKLLPYDERPQGEWEESHIFSCGKILQMRMDVIEHKCKHCGIWSIKWVGTIPDNFCSYCGASIKEVKKND